MGGAVFATFQALKALNLDIARRAFVRLRDTRYIDLVGRIEAERRQAGHDDQALIATVLAHQVTQASRAYQVSSLPCVGMHVLFGQSQWPMPTPHTSLL